MVVVPRSEVKRTQIAGLITCVLALIVLFGTLSNFQGASDGAQVGMFLLSIVCLAGIFLSIVAILSHRGNGEAILFQEGDQFAFATNQLHAGFKLRFLRNVLDEHVVSFSDEEREHWKVLEPHGFHAVFKIQKARKTLLLPLCFMLFDDVFVVDHTRRWDHYNSKSTSEPTYSDRGVGPFDVETVLRQTEG
jgi:hypothetical protein